MNGNLLLLLCLLVLMLTLATGMLRAVKGPTLQDRMVSVQLVGTGGVAVLLLLTRLMDAPALQNVALLLAMLAAVAAAALTIRRAADG